MKEKIFNKATKKIKNNNFIKTIIFTSLLLTNARLTPDLIAEETPSPTPIETTIKDTEIQINCNADEKYLALQLKNIILDLNNHNDISKIIIKSLEENNTTIEISETNDISNGYYVIGSNKIYIPKNVIENTLTSKDKLSHTYSLQKAIIHETIHMLQDKKGIFKDCEHLSPLDSSIVYTLSELDAICKSYIVMDTGVWDTNLIFECLKDMIPCLENYTKKGLYLSQTNNNKSQDISIEKVLKKLNNKGFDDYENISKMIETAKAKISPEIMEEILIANNAYNGFENNMYVSTNLIQKEF